jgi:hypothetical protein
MVRLRESLFWWAIALTLARPVLQPRRHCPADSGPANTEAKPPLTTVAQPCCSQGTSALNWWCAPGLLEHIVPLRICGRESRHHVLAKQRLVEVGGDLHVIRNENDHTLFAFAGHDPKDYDLHWYPREGADPNIFIDLRH